MSKRPLAALKEVYEDADDNPDLEYVAVLFDNESAAREFKEWAKERTAISSGQKSISVQPFKEKGFIVAFQTFVQDDGTQVDFREEVATYLNRFKTPIYNGTRYTSRWDEKEIRTVQRLAYGENACKDDERVKWELEARFADTLKRSVSLR